MKGTVIVFERLIKFGELRLFEELKVESGDAGEDQFFYRSHWGDTTQFSEWGYWQTFPKGTPAWAEMGFLNSADWRMKR